MYRVLPFLLLSLILAACAPAEASTQEIELPDTFALGTPFWIGIDQSVSEQDAQQDGSLQLMFLDVPEDSRCPVGTNINCVWAGQVTIRLQASLSGSESEVSLTFPNSRMGASSAALFNLYTIELLAVEPQPASLDPIEHSAYRAQLIIREGLPTPTPAPETFPLGIPFWIDMDSTLVQADGSLRLFFLDVPKDERCPVGTNINCAEEGPVIVWLQTTMDGATGEAWLTLPDLNQGVSRAVLFDAYTIELLAVEPQRTSLDRIERSAYRAQLIVTEDQASGSQSSD